MKNIPLWCLILPLAACDNSPPMSANYETCLAIAQSRLKHPDSFEFQEGLEKTAQDGLIHIGLTFSAWNGYKVPIPHKIDCIYQPSSEASSTELIAIKWNGRAIRQHELDDIIEKFK